MSNKPFGIETSTIGLTLWNPTDEDLDMQYSGISLTLKAGEKWACEISCAKHLLNGFGARGLTSIPYGGNEEQIGAEAIKRNLEFKKRQIIEYNQRNENRKQQGMGYLPPTPYVKKCAIDLAIKLLEPYAIRDEEREGISATRQENEKLKAEMAELREMLKTIMDAPKPPEKKGDFQCDVCEKWFSSPLALSGHKRSHGINSEKVA